jgi:hypothetical protein
MKRTSTFLLLLSVLCATPVFAVERKFPASMCSVGSDERAEMDYDPSGGIRNRSDGTRWRQITLHCPVIVDDTLPLRNIRRFNVDVVDRNGATNGQISARACVTFRYAAGGWCSPNPEPNGAAAFTGWSEIQVPYWKAAFSPWTLYSIDYPYIEVTLPGNGVLYGNAFSVLLGYTVSDTP